MWWIYTLCLVILASAIVYFSLDHAMARFRRDPDPARADAMRRCNLAMGWAFFFFFMSFPALGFSMSPSGGKLLAWLLYAFAFGFALLSRAMFGAARKPLERLPPNGGGRLAYFAAKSATGDKSDIGPRTYKVFIAPAMLCGALTYDRMEPKTGGLVRFSWNPLPLGDSLFYDAVDVTSPAFCRLGARNFQIAWRDVAGIDCDPVPKGRDVVDTPNSGTITVRLKSGEPRELIVPGTRDVQALRDELQRLAAGAGT